MIALSVLVALSLQSPAPLRHVQATLPTPPAATAPASTAPSSTRIPGSPADILSNLTRNAEAFQTTIRDVQAAIETSKTSRERGTEALDKMLAAVQTVQTSVSEDSELWKQIDAMLKEWLQQQRRAEENATRDSAYRQQADAWAERIRQAADLRARIVDERGRTMVMLDNIQRDRELILGWYGLGDADKALAGLTKIGDELKRVNQGLQGMVESARKLAPGAAN